MDVFRISLFGHRSFSAHARLDVELVRILRTLLSEHGALEVLVGRSGEFDVFSASVVKRLMREVGSEILSLTLVLPYKVADIEYYTDYYTDVIIPECLASAHPKSAIGRRNRYMIDSSHLSVFFVERESGGAYEALKYALATGKATVNLASLTKNN